jgi:protein-S-isoprenylcysteine O-methyltransferase Ste14
MPIDFSARPNVLPWPPLMFLLAFVAALALGAIAPLRLDLPGVVRAIGAVLIVGGLVLYGWGVVTMSAFLGLGVAANRGWICLAALVVALAIDRFGMAREEAHTAARFGDAWTRYAVRTPRWLGVGSLRVVRGRDEA